VKTSTQQTSTVTYHFSTGSAVVRRYSMKPKKDGFLGYDPILMAQGTPQDMQHATPLIQGTSAELVASLLWGGDNKSAICVSLAHREGAWRITNALDMQTEEKQQECGDMKTAAGE
jgi:hypothetical protein